MEACGSRSGDTAFDVSIADCGPLPAGEHCLSMGRVGICLGHGAGGTICQWGLTNRSKGLHDGHVKVLS